MTPLHLVPPLGAACGTDSACPPVLVPDVVPLRGFVPVARRATRSTGSSRLARRDLLVVLHDSGLDPAELVRLQLSDVVEHPAGLVVLVPSVASRRARPRHVVLGARRHEPVRALHVWLTLREQTFHDRHGRSLQPEDRLEQRLSCPVSAGGRLAPTRLSELAVVRILHRPTTGRGQRSSRSSERRARRSRASHSGGRGAASVG